MPYTFVYLCAQTNGSHVLNGKKNRNNVMKWNV